MLIQLNSSQVKWFKSERPYLIQIVVSFEGQFFDHSLVSALNLTRSNAYFQIKSDDCFIQD